MNTKSTSVQDHGRALLDRLTAFLGQYLSCSPDQLDLLALWALHTYCFSSAPASPSLYIHSREKQSGKTLCLELLSLVSSQPWLHTAVAPSVVLHQLQAEDFAGCLLFDDCHVTFGSSRMNPRLQGVITAGFKSHGRHSFSYRGEEIMEAMRVNVFCPKAFAGQGLPPCLAELSIPVALEPKQSGSPCRRFRYEEAAKIAKPMVDSFNHWAGETVAPLGSLAPYKEDQFPPELSSRQQDCAEPLLHLADLIGGDWPQRARCALVNAFTAVMFEDPGASLQLLSDLRDAFLHHDDQGWLSTATILDHLHNLEDRSWHEWHKGKPLDSSDLARLLHPFGIGSRNHRTSPTTVAKGYYREDLIQSWECHLPPCSGVAAESWNHSVPAPAGSGVAAKSRNHQLADPTCSGVATEFTNQQVAAQPSAQPSSQPWSTAAPGCDDVPAELWNHPIPDPACSAVAAEFTNHSTPS
jgi:hypothetical protein